MIGGLGSSVVFLLRVIGTTCAIGDQLLWWFRLSPVYCVADAIIWSSSGVPIYNATRGPNSFAPDDDSKLAQCGPVSLDLWSLDNLGGSALMLVVNFVFCTLVLILIELRLCESCRKLSCRGIPGKKMIKMDDDVEAEEERVAAQIETGGHAGENDVIKVSEFRKAYTTWFGKPFLAVERVSFGIDYGECFALLGVNGAGKTTTFKSLTGDVLPTSGKIQIDGRDIQNDFEHIRKLIGYCPQKDAIFPLMTVEEHIQFFCKIKGIPKDRRPALIESTITEMNLKDHREKCAGTLSGGNKRKLSVANAIIGDPPLILLDEPSAGMDPEARRFMWSIIAKISQQRKNSAVILTTHSMEEAEALSTKMGIMVRGGIFTCLGSTQHIKNKFGTGYELEIKVRKATW